MQVACLGSGSSGNSFWFESNGNAFLIDAGFSVKTLLMRASLLRLDPGKLRAIAITHEHGDHVRGARGLARKLGIPILLTAGTRHGLPPWRRPEPEMVEIVAGESHAIADFSLLPIPIPHDCREPVCFRIEQGDKTVVLATDIGHITNAVADAFAGADLLVAESNHDRTRLERGPYPNHLKKRILAPTGHLSNSSLACALKEIPKSRLRHLVLAHLSRTNNRPELALESARKALAGRGVAISLTSQSEPGPHIQLS